VPLAFARYQGSCKRVLAHAKMSSLSAFHVFVDEIVRYVEELGDGTRLEPVNPRETHLRILGEIPAIKE
jgi:hypothetical protein